jgi:hypothetical protein
MMLAFVTGCATQYEPKEDYIGIPHGGYSEVHISADTVAVNFSGNRYTPQRTIEAYLLYRCAQVTLDAGYDYFVVMSTTGSATNLDVTTMAGLPYYRASQTAVPHAYQTVNVAKDGSLHGAVAVIKMLSGPMPPHFPHAFRATDVIAQLGPTTF